MQNAGFSRRYLSLMKPYIHTVVQSASNSTTPRSGQIMDYCTAAYAIRQPCTPTSNCHMLGNPRRLLEKQQSFLSAGLTSTLSILSQSSTNSTNTTVSKVATYPWIAISPQSRLQTGDSKIILPSLVPCGTAEKVSQLGKALVLTIVQRRYEIKNGIQIAVMEKIRRVLVIAELN